MKKIIAQIIGMYFNLLAILAPRHAGKVGFDFFCYPFRTPISKKHLDFLKSASHGHLNVEGVQIQVYRWGSGPKNILFVHGWQSYSYRWKTYIEAINKKEFTLYAFDAPGHGLSTGKFLSAPLYEQAIHVVVKKLGTVHCLVGHSFGSFASLYHLFKNPSSKIRSLVAMASPGEACEFFDHYKKALGLSNACLKAVMARFEETFHHSPSYFSAPYFASAIDIPCLIIHDEADMETLAQHSKRLHQALKNSELLITKDAGHNLKSSEVLNKVVGFINKSSPSLQFENSKNSETEPHYSL